MSETIDIESQALTVRETEPVAQVGLFGTSDPTAVIQKASIVATALRDVIRQQGLISKISGKEYPKCEAWTLLGTMLGVFPVLEWTRKLENGWEARVCAKTKDGSIVGAAEAECLRSEKNWSNRDDFALRSMAQTRATAKCLRMPLGFVMTLSGFEPTPAEEMTFDNAPGNAGRSPDTKNTPANAPRANSGAPIAVPANSPKPLSDQEKADHAMFLELLRKKVGNPALEPAIVRYLRNAKDRNGAIMIPINGNLEDLHLNYLKGLVNKWDTAYPKIEEWLREHQEHVSQEPPPAHRDPEWFFGVICPIPHKGEKKSEYERHPDTIQTLYDAMKGGDSEAQKRLWGFANNWKPEPFNNKPPTQQEHLFREALDAFIDWEAKHDQRTIPPVETYFPPNQEDDVPF